jgi:Polysaccharide pyruvyl transferase
MKIGLLTFHFGYNYGGILQAFALQQLLKRHGHDVSILNYHPYKAKSLSLLRGWGFKSGTIFARFKTRYLTERMTRNCDNFRKRYFNLTDRCSDNATLARFATQFDCIIVGSDQVWNLLYHVGPEYFIGWEPPFAGKRISYAASCGSAHQPVHLMPQLGTFITAFDELSVRDKVTFDFVHHLTGRLPEIVADPTLLYDFSDISLSPPPLSFEYILMYVLGEEVDGGHRETLAQIRRRHGQLPVVQIVPVAHKSMICPGADKTIFTASPEEWIRLLSGASFIYTDSFHAALFSLKFSKPFLAYYSEPLRSARLVDFAIRYEVHHGVIASLQDAVNRNCFDTVTDFDAVHARMRDHVSHSLAFLERALSSCA